MLSLPPETVKGQLESGNGLPSDDEGRGRMAKEGVGGAGGQILLLRKRLPAQNIGAPLPPQTPGV